MARNLPAPFISYLAYYNSFLTLVSIFSLIPILIYDFLSCKHSEFENKSSFDYTIYLDKSSVAFQTEFEILNSSQYQSDLSLQAE